MSEHIERIISQWREDAEFYGEHNIGTLDSGQANKGMHRLAFAVRDLLAMIGEPPAGMHPDEWKPRAKTWHEERLNWIGEVNALRNHIKELEDGAKHEQS